MEGQVAFQRQRGQHAAGSDHCHRGRSLGSADQHRDQEGDRQDHQGLNIVLHRGDQFSDARLANRRSEPAARRGDENNDAATSQRVLHRFGQLLLVRLLANQHQHGDGSCQDQGHVLVAQCGDQRLERKQPGGRLGRIVKVGLGSGSQGDQRDR